MTTKTIECIDCGESVPYGRLSCPGCGALLASVAGALRAPIRAIEAVESPEPETVDEPESAAETEPVAESRPEAGSVAQAESAPEPVAESEPELVVRAETQPEPDPELEAAARPVAAAEPGAEAVAEPEPTAEPEPDDIAAAVETPHMPDPPGRAPWLSPEDDDPVLEPRPYARQQTSLPDAVAASPAAYRPPTLALAAATAAGPSWPAGTAALGVPGRSSVDPIADPKVDDASETSVADRSVELAGWFVIAGAAMSVLGFLLPWSRVVIGSANTGGYFDMWGLASPSHVIVVAGLLGVLGLGVVPTRVPAWIRTGVLGLAAGGILVGLAWPYVVGPLGADVGLALALSGGIALGIGGVLASWATRHASEVPSV